MPPSPESVGTPLTLITCHANADFDAFASLIAATYLYPHAVLVFPGTQERALQQFFADTATFMYNFKDMKDIALEDIQCVVIVDTRQRSRVAHVHAALDKTGVTIHVWDHHPDSNDDIAAHESHCEALGATTSLIIREIRARHLQVSCQDATVLGLGIYCDTGSFTFTSTTPEDYHAAAWLRSLGMDVNMIADLAAHELTSVHVQALNSLLESASTYIINTVPVVMAEVSMQSYLGDFAYLAHKLMEMEHFDVLFALGRMEDRVLVVARSRKGAINVGQVCTFLGGGGHAYAASATVRDKTMHQVRDIIFQQLYAQANPDKFAADYMSSPAVGIEDTRTVSDAQELMLHFGLKAVPVFKNATRQCVGILDAQIASRAAAHGLGELPVTEYMQRRVHTVSPQSTLHELTEIIIGQRQRLVPVVTDTIVVGVVTRTDMINVFAETSGPLVVPVKEKGKTRNVAKFMRDRLPKDTLGLLETAGRLASQQKVPVYAVGGFVRDLLLDCPNQDIDLVVEGNGIDYARLLAKELNGRVREHQEFLTAVVIFEQINGLERHIDVATARLEYYEYPAAMPTVELSSLKMDLFRRDFTVNALAIRLERDKFGQLVDFFGGQRDINDKLIRVLHALSFVEDPTRCLRAVRFEQRYRFKLGTGTERLIKNALSLKLMDRLSGARLFHELKLIFEENDPLICLNRLDALGILEAIHPQLSLNPAKLAILTSLKEMLDWYRILYFDDKPNPVFVYIFGLCRNLTYYEASAIFDRLGIPKKQKNDFLHLRERIRAIHPKIEAWQRDKGKVSTLYALLHNMPLDGLLYMMGRTTSEDVRKNISRYITQWRSEKVDITGDDLCSMGLKPGPLFGKIMRQILTAKLDGAASSRDSQRILALALATQYDNHNPLS
ncbi:MAG: CBS domain-containing protein [Desulfovibrionaceae bacterium]